MNLWYLANLVIIVHTVNRITPSSGEIYSYTNTTNFYGDVILQFDPERENVFDILRKEADKLRSLLEEINQSSIEKLQEKQETPRDILHEENLFLKELKEYVRQLFQQNLKLSGAVQRIESKLSKIEHRLNSTELSTRLLLGSSTTDLGEPLLAAVRNGDVERVLLLLEVGAPIEYEDSHKNRPIHIAVQNSHPRILEILLENKADIESQEAGQRTALNLAGYINCVECARILIGKGANLESRDQFRNTPIINPASAGFNDFVELLLDQGANVNANAGHGMSALHWAARNGQLSTVKLLFRKGANVRLQTSRGKTAYDLAVDYKHRSVSDFLNKVM